MKKIITLLLTLLVLQVYAQEPTLSLTSHTKDVDAEPKKPLIEISYQGKKVPLGRFANLDGIDPTWISTVTVLKDQSATALYGKDAKDGVIIIELKSSPETKAYFDNEAEAYRKMTRVDPFQDASNRNFEEQKEVLRPIKTTIRTKDGINYLENPPMVILELGDEKLELNKVQDLDVIQIELVDQIEVLKDKDSLKRYNAEGKSGVVVMKMKSGKKSAKEFKRLKKELKRNK